MKIKTAHLIGAPLDWAVGQALKMKLSQARASFQLENFGHLQKQHGGDWCPSINWSQGGPIIEREVIGIGHAWDRPIWLASEHNIEADLVEGPTPLIAAMRCYVASKLGDEVDIPEELVTK